MCSDNDDRESVVVLLSLKAPDGTTRFVDQIVKHKPDAETIKYFSWKTAIFGTFDVFHLHWPEWILRDERLTIRWLKSCLALAFLARLFLTSTPVVRTLHNIEPHRKGGAVERVLLKGFDRVTTDYILLNPLTPAAKRSTIIRHGHYVDQFSQYPRSGVVPGRILFFGRIEPYKKVASLIEAFVAIPGDEYSLRVVGAVQRGAFPDGGESLMEMVRSSDGVSGRFEFVSDEQLVREITQAQLVVLHYSEMHNSGALLVALSLGRVVFSCPSPVNHWIQQEVGNDWLILDRELSPATLVAAVNVARGLPGGNNAMPNLDNRDWRTVAEQHYRVYRAAANSTKWFARCRR